MSTRCQIGFYDNPASSLDDPAALIYRHSDGYPQGEHGVLATLVPLVQTYFIRRGFYDAEYMAAFVLSAWNKDSVIDYGITQNLHEDIEYYYAVSSNKVKVYRPGGYSVDFKTMELVNSVDWW